MFMPVNVQQTVDESPPVHEEVKAGKTILETGVY